MTTLTIAEYTVHQTDGLYSLNDLHAASGGEERHTPNRFMRLDTTQALIAEISKTPLLAFKIQRGKYGGTYACRELVIAYAAWISPAFHLKVIRVFLAVTAPAASENAQQSADAYQLATAAVPHIAKAILSLGDNWKKTRKILAFTYDGKPYIQSVAEDAVIMSLSDIAHRLSAGPGWGLEFVSNKELADLAAACCQRLVQSIDYQQAKSEQTKATH